MKQKSIKANFIMNAILTLSSLLFPLITFRYVSRILLPAGTGRVEFAQNFINYFVMVAQLGIPTYGVRACAQVRDDREKLSRTVQELLLINLLMAVVSFLVLLAGIAVVPRLQQDRTLLLIMSSMIFLSAFGMEWLYRALEEYSYITVRSLIFKLIALVATLLLVKTVEDYLIYGCLVIFASTASNLVNFAMVHRYASLRPTGRLRPGRHMKSILVFFAMSCATTIYTNLDTVMLGFMRSDEDVGYYNAAVKIKVILVSLVTSLGTVLLPRVSYYVEKGRTEEFEALVRKAVRFVFWVSVPLTVFFILFAKQGILFLSGDAYYASIAPMKLIMPTLIFIGLSNIFGIQMLIPLGKEKTVLVSEIAGAVVDVILNAILIPSFGASGAAIGTLVAEFAVLVVQYWALRKEINRAIGSVPVWKILLAVVLASGASLVTELMGVSPFLQLLAAAAIFGVVYGLLLLLLRDSFTLEVLKQCLAFLKRGKKNGAS